MGEIEKKLTSKPLSMLFCPSRHGGTFIDQILKNINGLNARSCLETKNFLNINEHLSKSNNLLFRVSNSDKQPLNIINEIMIKYNNIYNIIVKRNPIDVYISKEKVKITNKYGYCDTSDITIKFEISEYLRIKKLNKEWFKNLEKTFKKYKINYDIFYYEELCSMGHDNIYKLLFSKLSKFFDGIKIKEDSLNIAIVKQDNCNNYNKKIENYDNVKDFINNEIAKYNIK
tara:strand:+ start:6972 stop:7658 length:687 start_codon:yes stop_codon:yes gene_type:complete